MQSIRLKVSELRPNPTQIRKVDKESDKYRELVSSIKVNGLLNPFPVKVGIDPETHAKVYHVVEGHHRFYASCDAGLTELDCNLVEADDLHNLAFQIVGNLQRIEQKPVEYSEALMKMLQIDPTMTKARLAEMVGKSTQWIDDRLSLVDLIPEAQQAVERGEIRVSNAAHLAKFSAEEQVDWIERAKTMTTPEFAGSVKQRQAAIRKAAKEGKAPGSETFQAISHLKPKADIENLISNASAVGELLSKSGATDVVSAVVATAKWVCSLDPDSVAEQKAKWDARQAEKKSKKDAREAEKKAKEASK